MTSERKIAANRKNAQKSTGPKTAAGRAVSSRNALQHGLSISIQTDPMYSKEIDSLANALALDQGLEGTTEAVFKTAEAYLEMTRIRSIRTWVLEDAIHGEDARFGRLPDLNGRLAKLGRYEKRALSKRKSALREQVRGKV